MVRACEFLLIVKRPVKVLLVIVMLPEFNLLLFSVTANEVENPENRVMVHAEPLVGAKSPNTNGWV
jgi:hypothetical protein